ncbi:uncharacterized protein B0P05DRAFT_541374 [Gilbertella persicaria]|uniref:uncharacterized protein n=1 Tax=Gilbertella persicaria TaxID=101096 RepID=UPI00221F6C39|nr:uncharacterized protein B0P05DRAFT_541374 [Gilbertella persicaria]KAI8079628.1 hypothetical protein B0P05DRAFT_541374 [Gilbertella persicaria]
MKFFTFALVGALATMVTALPTFQKRADFINDADASFYITSPLDGESYTAGSDATTKWNNGVPGPFTIIVLKGKNPDTMQPTGITLNAEGNAGKYTWKIPEDIPEGVYAFEYQFTDNGASKEVYSSQFKIKAAKASAPPSPSTPSTVKDNAPIEKDFGKGEQDLFDSTSAEGTNDYPSNFDQGFNNGF